MAWSALSLLVAGALSVTYMGTGDVRAAPAYYSFTPPAVGGTYTDPVFGTVIKRVSDATKTQDSGGGGSHVPFIANEYSTMSPFNQDDSRFLLVHTSYFGLYDGEGRFISDLPLDASSEPRWSRKDPNLLFYVSSNELRKFDVGTGIASLVHAFPEYQAIKGHGESDICFDGDHLVLAGDDRYVFVYELSSGRKGRALDIEGHGFDSLYITPDDHVTITWLQSGESRYQGIELFDREMTFLRQVTRAGGHMDVTRDQDGQEVAVWANAADRRPICRNGIVKVRLSDAQQTCLLSLDWSLAMHISAPDAGGWVFVSTHAVSDPQPGDGWKAYTNEILAVSLDGDGVKRLAHHRSRPFNNYWWQPRVSVSRDGKRLLYTSDYGLQGILGYPDDYADTYLISSLNTLVPFGAGQGSYGRGSR